MARPAQRNPEKETLYAPIGFMIDSPWLPGWNNISTMKYFTSDNAFLETNIKAIETFPGVMFLPDFWSEYGMCTEPSAFGSKLMWQQDYMPHADRIISTADQIKYIEKPNVKTDGLLPLVIQRLKNLEEPIKQTGHEIKFATSRGFLNIATFLMGTTEFLDCMLTNPSEALRLIEVVTSFMIDWLRYQKEMFPTIEGIFINDDLVGFIGEDECREFVVPYFKRVYNAFDSKVRYFHNDADGTICASFLKEVGVNIFNFSFEHSINQIAELSGEGVIQLGNIPPRDVLDAGTPEIVAAEAEKMWKGVKDRHRVIWSCGGGMPQNVPTENIRAFIETIYECESGRR